MARNRVRVTESNLDFSSMLFIEDMLDYVFQRFTVHRLPMLPAAIRNSLRPNADYTFCSEIGNALMYVLRSFCNISETIIEFSRIVRTEDPRRVNPSARVVSLLNFHGAAFLTDADFDQDSRVWCSQLLHYLVIASSLCLHYERRIQMLRSTDIICAASELLRRKMTVRTSEKIEQLKQYACNTLNEPLRTDTIIYELY